jgi:hypothetical protein
VADIRKEVEKRTCLHDILIYEERGGERIHLHDDLLIFRRS